MSDDEWQEVKGPRKRSGKGSRGTGPTTGGGGGRGSASPGSRGQGPSSSGRGAPDNQQPSTSRGAQDNQQPSTSRGAQNNQQASDDKTGKNLDKLKWYEVKDYQDYKIERFIDIVDARKMCGYFKKHIISYDWGARRYHLMKQVDPTTPHSYYTDELYKKFKSLGGDTSAEYDRFFGTKFTAVFNIKRFQHTLIVYELEKLKTAIQTGWVHLVVRLASLESEAANDGNSKQRKPNEPIVKYTRYNGILYILKMKLTYMVTRNCYSMTELVQNESGLNIVSDLKTKPVLDKEGKPIKGKVEKYRVQKSNRNTVTADDVARAFKRPESENPFHQNRFKKYVIALCEEVQVEMIDDNNTKQTVIYPFHSATSQALIDDCGQVWRRYRLGPVFFGTKALKCGKPMVQELYFWGRDESTGEPNARYRGRIDVEVIYNREEERQKMELCKAGVPLEKLTLKTDTGKEAESGGAGHQKPQSPYMAACSKKATTSNAGQSSSSGQGSFPHAKTANQRFYFERPTLARHLSDPDFIDLVGMMKHESIPESATVGEDYGTMTYGEYWNLPKYTFPLIKNVTKEDLKDWGAFPTKGVKVHYTSIWVDDKLVDVIDHTDENGESSVCYDDQFPTEELPTVDKSPRRNNPPSSGIPDPRVSGSPKSPPQVSAAATPATPERKVSRNKRKAASPLEKARESPPSPTTTAAAGFTPTSSPTPATTSTPVGIKSVKRSTTTPAPGSVRIDEQFVIHVRRLTGRDEGKSPGNPAPP